MGWVATPMLSQVTCGSSFVRCIPWGRWSGDRPFSKAYFLQCERRHPELSKIPTYLPWVSCRGVPTRAMCICFSLCCNLDGKGCMLVSAPQMFGMFA